MKVSIDDALEPGPHLEVEAIVRGVAEARPGTEGLVVTVVRVKPGVWHVFIREESPGQWSVLPSASHRPLVEALEAALRKAGV